MADTNRIKETTLNISVFTAPGKTMVGERPKPFGEPLAFDPITSTLIFGEYDAVLVDAMGTVAEANALADWIALHNRNLETIYITHAHFDHFYGLSILLDRFPAARAIATPNAVAAMQMSFSPVVERLARRLFPGQVPTKLVSPQPYAQETFTLEGRELRIIEQGRTDSPDSTSLYVPSIGLIVAGDVVYNQCRIYVGDTTPESRKNWIDALDRLSALNPATCCRRSQETRRARFAFHNPRNQALPTGLRSAAEDREVRPGTIRSDDRAIPGLGRQSIMAHVRIPSTVIDSQQLTDDCWSVNWRSPKSLYLQHHTPQNAVSSALFTRSTYRKRGGRGVPSQQ